MTRLELVDSLHEAILKLVEDNPGAIRVCTELYKNGAAIDPDNAMAGLAYIMSLDTLGIYGPRIWMLYKDVCGEDLVNTVAVLRSWQLGFLSEDKLNHAIDNRGVGVDVDDLLGRVTAHLDNFNKE